MLNPHCGMVLSRSRRAEVLKDWSIAQLNRPQAVVQPGRALKVGWAWAEIAPRPWPGVPFRGMFGGRAADRWCRGAGATASNGQAKKENSRRQNIRACRRPLGRPNSEMKLPCFAGIHRGTGGSPCHKLIRTPSVCRPVSVPLAAGAQGDPGFRAVGARRRRKASEWPGGRFAGSATCRRRSNQAEEDWAA